MAGLLREKEVFGIINRRRVLSAKSVIGVWNDIIKEKRTDHNFRTVKLPGEIMIRYRKETVESILGKPKWRLIFDPGISLINMRAILGPDNRKQPCHQFGNKWWFLDKGCAWTRRREEPGYYLVRISPEFCNITWTDQGLSMVGMGKEFVRASHRLMISLNVSYYLMQRVYPFEGFSHWGPKMDSEELDICASRVGINGFVLYRWNRNCPTPDLGVCVIRKHDSF
jgi:hypothetical protein